MNRSNLARLVLLAMIWGSSFLFMRIAVPQVGVAMTAGTRLALAALTLLAAARLLGRQLHWRERWRDYLLIGATSSALPFLMFAFAARSLPAGYSAVLNATTPLFAVLLAWQTSHARPPTLKFVGVALGMLGVAILARSGTLAAGWDTFAAFAAGLTAAALYALSAMLVKRRAAGFDSFALATGSQVAAALIVLPLAVLQAPAQLPHLDAIAALVALGLICTALAYTLYFRLIQEAGSERAVTVTFLVPAFAQLWGLLFLGESISAASVAGLGFVLAALGLVLDLPWLRGLKLQLPALPPRVPALAPVPCRTPDC